MHISCIDVIDNKLQDAIKKIKLTSLQSPNLSFLGIHQEIIENDEKIKFYSLLPNMEEIIILKITSSDNEKKHYMLKGPLIAEIKEETVKQLEKNLIVANYLFGKQDLHKMLEILSIPEEIQNINLAIENLCLPKELSTIDQSFFEYTNLLSKIRKMNLISFQYENKEGLAR